MAPIAHHLEPILASTFNDPLNSPIFCSHALFSALQQITMSIHALPFQTSFLRAAMKFLATPRTPKAHARLRRRLLTCSCDLSDLETARLHCPLAPGLTMADMFEQWFVSLCGGLALLISLWNPHVHDVQRRWPAQAADVCRGTDPAGLCTALLAWAEDGETGSGVFGLIGTVALTFPDFMGHVLRTPHVFALATTHLEAALERVPTQHASTLWIPRFGTALYACAGDLFYALARGREDRADALLRGILLRMYAIAKRMEAHLVPGEKAAMGASIAWFELVCHRVNRTFTPRGVAPPAFISGSAALEIAWAAIVGMRNVKCTLGRCQPTEAPKNSQVCAGCGVARYCSPEHQRESWKAQPYPHKAVCAKLKALRAAIRMNDDQEWSGLIHDLEAGRSSQRFRFLCFAYQVNSDLGKEILRALGRLPRESARYCGSRLSSYLFDALQFSLGICERELNQTNEISLDKAASILPESKDRKREVT
ncbi:hypothetical protein FB451DRAFT_1452687 [Mycena latifolia]|nr:hypothetical protein FB451DRAFT_1452687 [Mycena latifolia]